MAKKIVITSIAIMFLSLFCGFCFAADDMKTEVIDLGNDVNRSLDKAGQSVKNVTNDVMSGNIVNKTENGIKHVGNRIEDGTSTVLNRTAGAYNTVRTNTEATVAATGMSNTTWIWVVIAVLGVIIVSAVWYYVAQNNERKY